MKSIYPGGVSQTPRWRLWRAASLILMIFFLFLGSASASHYRYGTISWKRVPGAAPGTCKIEVTVKQAWRRSYFGPLVVGSFDGESTVVVSTLYSNTTVTTTFALLEVTSVNLVDDWFYGEFKDTITLPSDTASYRLWYSSCCRIGSLQNNANGSFQSESIVTPCNKGNDSPVSTQIPIVKLPQGVAANTFMVAASDPNGDPISYRVATSAEVIGTPALSFAVTPGGLASFNTVGTTVGDLYNVFVAIEDTAGAKILADFLIEVVDSSTPPEFDYAVTPSPASCFEVKPGDTVKFKVKAYDPDIGDSVFISAVGLPTGAILTPTLPTPGGNPDSVEFFWIPDTSDIGTTIISFTAEDTSGVQTSTSVCITVSLKPIFSVPPTPAKGAVIIAECGDTVEFDVEAYDPDPNDSVQIFKVEGKSMGGSKIPLYAGASFMPLPTPWGNPTSGHFFWPVDSSDWGPRNVFFTAKDGLGEITEHEVSILVNDPPKFLSTPDTCVYVDSTYCYHIEVKDKDTAYGDSVELFAFGLPGWLTFVDSGNGRGSLCGTPTLADLGMHAIFLEAQDVYHHDNGTTMQSFVITVKSDSVVPPQGPCAPLRIYVASDSAWKESTVMVNGTNTGPWAGVAGALPHDSTYTLTAANVQPYPWGGIPVLDSTQVIWAASNVHFYKKEFMVSNPIGAKARLRMYMDDGCEIYLNGVLILREQDISYSNFSGVPHDIRYDGAGGATNGYGGNQAFDYVGPTDLDPVFVAGMNELVVVMWNLKKKSNKGGFSMKFDIWNDCPVVGPPPAPPAPKAYVDSCVSDSSWWKSTVVNSAEAGGYPWPGVAALPHDSTFTLPVEIGQPYPWFSILSVPGSEVIKAPSYVTFYKKTFNIDDSVDVDARFRMYFDDNVEVYINGHLLFREDDIVGSTHFTGAYHDILFKSDGTVDNGHMGGDAFDYYTATDLDNVLKVGANDLKIALRNRKPADKGGFSFRMDMEKAGLTVLYKTAENPQAPPALAAVGHLPVQVYPNPTTSSIMVAMPAMEIYEPGTMSLCDMNGRVLYSMEITLGEISIMEVNLENYADGIYLLKVDAGEYRDVQRILKQ